MTRKFIPGLVGVVLVAGCLSARAMPAGDLDIARNYAVGGSAHRGNYVADFVQGRLVTAAPRAVALTIVGTDTDHAARYASESATLTVAFLATIAAALAGLAVVGGVGRRTGKREVAPDDGWKQTMSELLEVDLTSLDSVAHGFAGR